MAHPLSASYTRMIISYHNVKASIIMDIDVHFEDRASPSKDRGAQVEINETDSNMMDDDGRVMVAPSHCAPQLIVKVVSARYGPCEGGYSSTDIITRTRDVTPFIRALLIRKQNEEKDYSRANLHVKPSCHANSMTTRNEQQDDNNPAAQTEVRLNALSSTGMLRREITVLEHASMNSVFGDPCSGISKRLHIHYIIAESSLNGKISPASVQAHHMSFAEHEQVVLRRRIDSELISEGKQLSQSTSTHLDGNDPFAGSQREGTESFPAAATKAAKQQKQGGPTDSRLVDAATKNVSQSMPTPAHILSTASEIVLPMIMPFLDVRERVLSQLVCKVWRTTVRHWGVATVIANTDSIFSTFTRPIFRGILQNSFSSLQCLFLSDFVDLEKEDIHPAIPHLRKLRHLDVSRCCKLDDSTLELLSHVSGSLEVLYIKGLRAVTDTGVMSICSSCTRLRALDISCIHRVTDAAGVEIGRNLTNLRALYLRDNFKLTSQSVNVITTSCTKLEELTLWGCIRMQHLGFNPHLDGVDTRSNLRILNLWGCHGLNDNAAAALENMNSLRTLIAAECHKLTDAFVVTVCIHVPQLHHLNLRFCRLISDDAVHLVAQRMQNLYSLELSYCPKVTAYAVTNLLHLRGENLAELYLHHCRNLHVIRGTSTAPNPHQAYQDETVGLSMISDALRAHGGRCSLSVLDIRCCCGPADDSEPFEDNSRFVDELSFLGFEQKANGYFSRSAVWNEATRRRLVLQALT